MSVLAEICAKKLEHVRAREAAIPLAEMKRRAQAAGPVRRFEERIREFNADGEAALITEIKKASPSAGVIRADFNPALLARAYKSGGACCLSVLTDTPYFQGRDDHLTMARAAVSLPILRKDFMVSPYQIYESRALGADCILLIVAALEEETLSRLYDLAGWLNMDVLLEVHDQKELERALAFGGGMIGVNNRDLKTLKVDLNTALALAEDIPESRVMVAESGIRTQEDIKKLRKAGYGAFLVGEILMRQDDVTLAVRQLLGVGTGT
jgi:indole-3-glycerol phosphate synthase